MAATIQTDVASGRGRARSYRSLGLRMPATMMMPRVLRLRALRQFRIDLEFGQHRAGVDHVAGAAGEPEHLAGKRRRHFDHGLGGFHRNHWRVEHHDIADLDQPFDDLGIRQTFAQIGEIKFLDIAHR